MEGAGYFLQVNLGGDVGERLKIILNGNIFFPVPIPPQGQVFQYNSLCR